MSASNILEALQSIRSQLLRIRVPAFADLRHENLVLGYQLAFQERLDQIIPDIREGKEIDSHLRNRLKLLIQHIWGSKKTRDHQDRLYQLENLAAGNLGCEAEGRDQSLGCEALVLLSLVYKPGLLLGMKRDEFDYLMNHTVAHVVAIDLPAGWMYNAQMPSLLHDCNIRGLSSPTLTQFLICTLISGFAQN